MSSQIELSPEDFQEDLRHLGRANGNIWQRFPALAGVHDGQVMVRLKQLRFVILDYSIPNPQSRLIGTSRHVKVPRNAGVAICNTSGVGNCLFFTVASHDAIETHLSISLNFIFSVQRLAYLSVCTIQNPVNRIPCI